MFNQTYVYCCICVISKVIYYTFVVHISNRQTSVSSEVNTVTIITDTCRIVKFLPLNMRLEIIPAVLCLVKSTLVMLVIFQLTFQPSTWHSKIYYGKDNDYQLSSLMMIKPLFTCINFIVQCYKNVNLIHCTTDKIKDGMHSISINNMIHNIVIYILI